MRDGLRRLHALLRAAGIPAPYVLIAESSAALDAHVYAGSFPEDVAGLVFVNGVHPDLLFKIRPAGGRMGWLPEFVFHSQDQMAQLFNQVGFYRLGLSNRPAPRPHKVSKRPLRPVFFRRARSRKPVRLEGHASGRG